MNPQQLLAPRLKTSLPSCRRPRRWYGTPSGDSSLATNNLPFLRILLGMATFLAVSPSTVSAAELRAGVAKVDITDRAAGPVNNPLFAKALVVNSEATTVVLITIDAVAIGEIGRIGNDFLANVRTQLRTELGILPSSVLINASHCHGVVRADTALLTVKAVKQAWRAMVPVGVGAGVAHQDRISENRRLKMKDGSEVDMRRAYSMPRDEDLAGVGPIDPQVGLLRIDRTDGRPLALLYNFACHPIMGVPGGGNTADYPGFASKVIEDNLGDGTIALFVQGCAGDVNPVRYKELGRPADAEPLGNMLGLSALIASKKIATRGSGELKVSHEVLALPRGTDLQRRIAAIQAEQSKLLQSLKPTTVNFKTFLALLIEQKISPDFPSHYAQSYLHDTALGRDDLRKLDAGNRACVDAYLQNVQVMERLTRLNVNLALLKKHLAQNRTAGKPTLDVEVTGVRIGDFKMVTFPGELSVQVGLNIKRAANHPYAFVAGYTNGYIYYAPTAEQRNNVGYAQEDCDSLVAPQWQKIFETKALEILSGL
jgi:Na+-transporting NADH:ubiquinone oxidoreductase subunit NqrE